MVGVQQAGRQPGRAWGNKQSGPPSRPAACKAFPSQSSLGRQGGGEEEEGIKTVEMAWHHAGNGIYKARDLGTER